MTTTRADPDVLWRLFSASFKGDLEEVKTLLKNNSLSSDVSDPNTGSTALLWASSGGSLEVVEWLVKEAGAKATHHNKDNCTAFYYACEHGHKPVAEFLVGQRGVNVNDKDNSSGHSALHRLCIAGQTREAKAAEAKAIISWLIEDYNADVNAVDLAGRLPGEANLSVEAPNLKPTTLSIEIKEMLEDARQRHLPGTPKTDTSTMPSTAVVPPTPDFPVASDRPMRKPKPDVKIVPESRSEPVVATRASNKPPTATSSSHATGQPTMALAKVQTSQSSLRHTSFLRSVAPSSAPLACLPRNSVASASSAGAAATVIEASRRPNVSALVKAFENKTSSGENGSGLSLPRSGGSACGSLMPRIQMYLMAAKKGSHGVAAAAKEAPAPQLGKGENGNVGR